MVDEHRTLPGSGEPSPEDLPDDETVVDGLGAIADDDVAASDPDLEPHSDPKSDPHTYPKIEGFKILGPLGEGGMGTVWKAIQISVDREVALKLMASRMFASKMAETRFQREVKLAGKLDHPNIAQIYEAGLYKDIHYYAMRLVRGVSLQEYVARNVDIAGILNLMHKVCDAVGHAHEMGILHRDLKPSNVVVDDKGRPFVLDFGLAKAMDDDIAADHATTHEGSVVGTPAFMAPEQARGKTKDIDTRTDVYALGAMLYVLLTGEHPTNLTGSRFDVLVRIAEGEVKPIGEVDMISTASGESIPPQLEALVMKSLSKERDDRFPDAAALAQAIEAYLAAPPVNLPAVARSDGEHSENAKHIDHTGHAAKTSEVKESREMAVVGSVGHVGPAALDAYVDADNGLANAGFSPKKHMAILISAIMLGFLTLAAIVATIWFAVFWLVDAVNPRDVKEGLLGTVISFAMVFVLAFATWKLGRARPKKPPEVRCPECSYNMYGLSEPRCPECGATFTLDKLR